MVPQGDQIRHPGPPGWVLGIALTNVPHKKLIVTETYTRDH